MTDSDKQEFEQRLSAARAKPAQRFLYSVSTKRKEKMDFIHALLIAALVFAPFLILLIRER